MYILSALLAGNMILLLHGLLLFSGQAVSVYSSLKKQCFHLLLKWTGYLLCAPLYITSYVETVQSFGANDSPSLFEFLTEGCSRLFGRTYQHTWMVPMWTLLVPTATFRLCHYGVQQVTSHLVLRYLTEEKQATEMQDDSSVDYVKQTHHEQIYPGLVANFVSFLVADIVMFPCETVLHRLYIQGTRVLTDNMDHGREVLGVHFRYNGIFDCFWQILRDEGMNAFFRGFGALMLQYSCHFIGLRLISYAFRKCICWNEEKCGGKKAMK
ncbi:mitochondrial outer membrane protein SLC25A46-like [Mya arenaria]|uniref:mitochondrial outer membrane protein SLC25A46-like n=1 Tax=Mya arenaria TaxID=6604 RepID=UPI0022E5CF31|nr:mitochondrial outer membrane protein SLC25A46-like [Mya arenaria]